MKWSESTNRKVYQKNSNIKAAEAIDSQFCFRFLSHGYDVRVQPRASPNISRRERRQRKSSAFWKITKDSYALTRVFQTSNLPFQTLVWSQRRVIPAAEERTTRRGSFTARRKHKKRGNRQRMVLLVSPFAKRRFQATILICERI
jgi:hypothetical protein